MAAVMRWALIFLIWVFSLISFLPAWHYLIEVLINCSHYLIAANLLVFLLILFSQKRLLIKILANLFTLVLIVVQSSVFMPFIFGVSKPAPFPTEDFKLFYANVERGRGNQDQLRALINQSNSQLVALLEVNQDWLDRLNLAATYPYNIVKPADNHFGLALYSKFPISEKLDSDFGSELTAHIVADLVLPNEKNVQLIVVHAIPPLSAAALRHNRLLFRRIATHARNSRSNVMLVGDFNATPYSDNFQKLTSWAKMRHAATGLGLYSSWNAHQPWLRFMIDHVLVKGCLVVNSFHTLSKFGSDHYPLLVELGACNRAKHKSDS